MRVWTGDPRMWGPGPDCGTAVTIGVFDGVHRGHQQVLAGLSLRALEFGNLEKVVVTFDIHPRSLLTPARAPKMLTTVSRRLELLESMGIDQVGVLPFTLIRHLAPEEFVRCVVVRGFTARVVSVGHDFRYGTGRSGDVAGLRARGEVHGFVVEEQELLAGERGPVSSSAIRRSIAEGDMVTATVLLGRQHRLYGSVVAVDRRGASLGIPGALVEIDRSMAVPCQGVYAVWTEMGGDPLPGLCYIGPPCGPASPEDPLAVHVLDWSGDLQAREIGVRFVERIRGLQPGKGVERQATRIAGDAARVRRLLG